MYHTSPYTIYCQKFVPESEQDPPSPYRELLRARGQEHERRVIASRYPGYVPIEYQDPEEGFRRLLEEMANGAEVICGLPLFFLPENLQGRPDILEKDTTAPSIFGDYHYVVKEVKLAKNIAGEHILQGAFYNYLVGQIQDFLPESFFVINRDGEEHDHPFRNLQGGLVTALKGTQAILDGEERPTPTYNGCDWPWATYCNHEALRMRDVSIIPHVGREKKALLVRYRFKRIWDVSSARAEDLERVPGIGSTLANKLILGAKAINENRLIGLEPSAIVFPARGTEIFLDLEGTDQPGREDGLEQVDYLIGALVRKEGQELYYPFLAQRLSDEARMFSGFLNFMREQRDYVLYHWHNYERWHIRQLGERHGLIGEVEARLFSQMIDLHQVATKAYVFPTYSNGLKDIAAFFGFKWRHKDINALDAIAYYLKYQDDPGGYEEKMRAIVDYNEDDCRATALIRDRLLESAEA